MNVDSKDGRKDVSLGWVKQRLRELSAVEPPQRLRESLLAAVPGRTTGATAPVGRWSRATSWAGVAATITVLCGALWLRPQNGPSARPSPDANNGAGRVLAADYNSVRPADINTLDSNGL